MCEDKEEKNDLHFTPDVRDYLFFNPCSPRVLDLFAIDIARARDHSIAPYIYYVEYCTGKQIKSWDELLSLIPPEILDKLKTAYKSLLKN